ncbi:MAG: hypothetical protein JRI97_06175 [Deltaproteobacteria bacterium]|nr:hypothetical protein [Deltaproteobacteria bacterium]
MEDNILTFINGTIKKYIIPDLERLQELRPEDGLVGCTIPTAMLLFAVVELFGYLISDGKAKLYHNTKANFLAIFEHKITGFSPEYIQNLDILVEYRHSLMHQIFPRYAAISKAGTTDFLFCNNGEHICLNVDCFSKDVINMIDNLDKTLHLDEWADLRKQMSERIDKIIQLDEGKMRKIFDRKGSTVAHVKCPGADASNS